jgi:hypothetical protein
MKDSLTCWDVKKGQVVFKAGFRRFEDEELTTNDGVPHTSS